MRSAPAFHDMTTPLRSLLTIASSDDEMIAAKRYAARSDAAMSVMSRSRNVLLKGGFSLGYRAQLYPEMHYEGITPCRISGASHSTNYSVILPKGLQSQANIR